MTLTDGSTHTVTHTQTNPVSRTFYCFICHTWGPSKTITKDDAMTQVYTCSWTKAVHVMYSSKNSSVVRLLEGPPPPPPGMGDEAYNVLETRLVIYIQHETWKRCAWNVGIIVLCIQWNLVLTRTSGPWKLPCYIRVKKQRNIKNWDQQNYLVIRGFCYIRPLYNEVPMYCDLPRHVYAILISHTR